MDKDIRNMMSYSHVHSILSSSWSCLSAEFLRFTVQDECDRLMADKWGYTLKDMHRYLS
jgi:hypothetical protein